jgi:Omp85 superfamily domain/WD40-like Beta Propeller Repeat
LGFRSSVKKLIAALLAALSLSAGVREAQAGDPRLQWYTLETPHFRVSFHGGLEPLAQRAAAMAERAYTVLGKDLDQTPSELVEILLTDDSDYANGSAGAVPYNTIRLYATAPDDMSALGDYDDWLNELLTHEYTHIVHVDNVSGLPALLNKVMGKTSIPNQWQPRWILEGLAVAMETTHTSGGRLRSSQFDMYLRADVLERRFAGLDAMSGSPRRFPGGNIWYLYGSAFVAFINDTYGPNTFAAVADDYGAQLVPWGINRSIRRVTGRTYEELYDGWRASLEKRYAAQAAALRARGLREGRRLTSRGEVAFGARLTEGCSTLGKPSVIYERDDGHTVGGVYEVALDGSNPGGKLRARAAGQQVSLAPDCSIVFDSGAISQRRYYFQDLFRQLPGTSSREEGDTRTRITQGLRARHADVSPDGRQVVFVTNDRSTSTLRIAELSPDYQLLNVRALVPSARFEQAYTPRFSPDGRAVAYSAWTTGGYRDVRVVDVATGRFRELFHDRALDQQPTFSRDGRHLYFTSDRSGIANVYVYELSTGALSQVTNVLTGAYFPEVSSDGRTLVYTGYTSRGWELFVLENEPSRWLPATPYVSTRGPGPDPVVSRYPLLPYDPLRTLRPRQYYVEYAPGMFGQQLTFTTTGNDLAGLHGIAAAISVPVTRQQERTEPALSLDYAYARRPYYLRLSGFRSSTPRRPEEYVVNETALATVEHLTGVTTGVSIGLPGDNEAQSASLSYTVAEVYQQLPLPPPDPFSALGREPYRGLLGLIHLGYGYSNVESSNYAVSKERGFEVSFGFDYAGRVLGSDTTLTSFSATATGYVLMPWLRHHVLAVALSGGTSHGTYPRRGLFAVGGYADEPLLDSFRSNLRQSAFRLRGYRPLQFFGSDFNLLNVEYRAPIWYADRGISTLPLFLRSVAGAMFFDYGAAYDQLDLRDPLEPFHGAVGAELWLDLYVGYYTYGNLRLGAAKGLSAEAPGGVQTYLVLSSAF